MAEAILTVGSVDYIIEASTDNKDYMIRIVVPIPLREKIEEYGDGKMMLRLGFKEYVVSFFGCANNTRGWWARRKLKKNGLSCIHVIATSKRELTREEITRATLRYEQSEIDAGIDLVLGNLDLGVQHETSTSEGGAGPS